MGVLSRGASHSHHRSTGPHLCLPNRRYGRIRQTRYVIIGVVALALVAALALAGGNPAGPEQTLALQAPPFVEQVDSAAAPPEVAALLSSQAGISAYVQTAGPITLSAVRGVYRTIEADTTDYIIGSVAIPDHPEHFDVHVYVHKDGWILAYYLQDGITSKIVNVRARSISTTKLETAVSIAASAAGQAVTGLRHYDFRYPNATHMLVVAEDHLNGRDFTITLPTEFAYYDRSFAVYNVDGRDSSKDFWVDGVAAARSRTEADMTYGAIPASQLIPGQPHHITLSHYSSPYGALVIVYRVP
jgi:hypothetical protein